MFHMIKMWFNGWTIEGIWLFIADFLIVLLILREDAWKLWNWWSKRRRLARTFGLALDSDNYFGIPAEATTLLKVTVTINEPTELGRFTFRFVTTPKGGNAPANMISIERIIEQDGGRFSSPPMNWPDKEGGCDGGWVPHLGYKGESFHFSLLMKITAPWSGYLSFQAYDMERNIRFVRVPVEFTKQPSALIGEASLG
jgi:hypothetical protein